MRKYLNDYTHVHIYLSTVYDHTVKLYMYLHCYGTVCRPPGRKWLVETATNTCSFCRSSTFQNYTRTFKSNKNGKQIHVVCND